jgi:hypothetical protein
MPGGHSTLNTVVLGEGVSKSKYPTLATIAAPSGYKTKYRIRISDISRNAANEWIPVVWMDPDIRRYYNDFISGYLADIWRKNSHDNDENSHDKNSRDKLIIARASDIRESLIQDMSASPTDATWPVSLKRHRMALLGHFEPRCLLEYQDLAHAVCD